MLKLETIKTLDTLDTRSAWARGVNAYARELLDGITNTELVECVLIGGNEGYKTLLNALLNGADNWSKYSWGGCALVYDSDIAERLCAPWELKRTRNGERRPNSREEWLDTQARALHQASIRIWTAAKKAHAHMDA